ncbi:MAG: hypothetical protein LLF94_03355, partial [Chlamydiales bacterium]|nr:hypothetical protein [Chlamydiales bacterium]
MIMAESPNLSSLPRHSSSKALTLARSAEVELNRPKNQGLQTAITTLEELTDDQSFRRLQNDERIIVYNMLIDAYLRADMGKEAENLSAQLLKDEAFKPYWIALRVRLGNSLLAQENLSALAKNIKELLRYPKRRLSSDDAEAITTLWAKIERHSEAKRKAADRLWGLKEYAKAAKLYQYLFDSSHEHSLNNTFSKENHIAFIRDVSYRLAACYFLETNYEKALTTLTTSDPKTSAGYILKGLTEKNLGQYNAAFCSFQKVVNPSDKVLWETCFAALKAGLNHEARKLLAKLPDLPASTVLEVLVEISDGHYDQAKRLIQHLNKDSSYHYLQGYLALQLGAKETACKELEQAILIRSPYQTDALLQLGKTYVTLATSKNNFLDRAHTCFETLSNKSGVDKIEGILGMASVYASQKALDKLEKLEASLEKNTLT